MFCPQCHTEYRPGFDRCADCDLPLVQTLPEPPPPTAPEELYEGAWVTVANLTMQTDVSLLKAMLDADSIPFIARNDSSVFIMDGTAIPCQFLVPETERERATKVVEQLAEGYQPSASED